MWPSGYGRRVLAQVDSTNAQAARIAADLAGPEWILALSQNAGRGRRGRVWVVPEGNFSASLVMFPSEPPQVVALRSFVAALAVYDAAAHFVGPGGLSLKWPNDVLYHGGKLAGILLERGAQHLAIGIGVNLLHAPEVSEAGAVTPVALGGDVTPEVFLDVLAQTYAQREQSFITYGFAPIREAWLMRAARLGEEIEARLAHESHRGIFETVDEEGNLVLKTANARMSIAAADVFF